MTGQGEWFADADGQWTWRQEDGSHWRQVPDGSWQQLAVEAVPEASAALPQPFTAGAAAAGAPVFGAAPVAGDLAAPAGPTFGFQSIGASSPPHPGPPPVSGAYGSPGAPGGLQAAAGVPGSLPAAAFATAMAGDGGLTHHETLPGGGAGYHDGLPAGTAHLDHADGHTGHMPGGYPGGVRPETSAMAVWALVLGVLPPFCYVNNVFAIILGLEARHHVKHSHGTLRGKTPAVLAVVFGLAWLVTIPMVVHNAVNLYHSAKSTTQDEITKTKLKDEILTAANGLETADHSYAGLTGSEMTNLPGVTFSPTCGKGVVCLVTGNGNGYSFMQFCELTGSGHAWTISATSGGGSAWYGESALACPTLGDPGSATGQPVQQASWRSGGFPGIQFHFQWEWKF